MTLLARIKQGMNRSIASPDSEILTGINTMPPFFFKEASRINPLVHGDIPERLITIHSLLAGRGAYTTGRGIFDRFPCSDDPPGFFTREP
jgi:hypothetical protein